MCSQPRGVTSLNIIAGYPYRAHWDVDLLDRGGQRRYGRKINRAREGLQLLLSKETIAKGVSLRAMEEGDYSYLVSMTDEECRVDFALSEGNSYDKESKENVAVVEVRRLFFRFEFPCLFSIFDVSTSDRLLYIYAFISLFVLQDNALVPSSKSPQAALYFTLDRKARRAELDSFTKTFFDGYRSKGISSSVVKDVPLV
jgi:hypothetical protein